jgi:hypothetical protein
MYADPPYWKLAGYGVEFGWEHYQKMAELMKSCKVKLCYRLMTILTFETYFLTSISVPLKLNIQLVKLV